MKGALKGGGNMKECLLKIKDGGFKKEFIFGVPTTNLPLQQPAVGGVSVELKVNEGGGGKRKFGNPPTLVEQASVL